MKATTILPLLFLLTFGWALTPSSPVYEVDSDQITFEQFEKRETDISLIASILNSVNNSGIIIDLLHEISEDEDQVDNLSNIIIETLEGNDTVVNDLLGSVNITLNYTKILDAVIDSGVVNTTLDYLLKDTDNRIYLAKELGGSLTRNVWVSWLLTDLCNGKELSFDLIHYETTRKSKATNMQQLYDQINEKVRFGKRDNNSGSAATFLNNLVNSVIDSQLAQLSLSKILLALNESNIIGEVVLEAVGDNEVKNLLTNVTKRVYDSGVLDKYDLNKYYVELKEHNYLSDGVQVVLTDPNYSPYVADFLHRMEANGVYKQCQWNMYGGPPKVVN